MPHRARRRGLAHPPGSVLSAPRAEPQPRGPIRLRLCPWWICRVTSDPADGAPAIVSAMIHQIGRCRLRWCAIGVRFIWKL